MYFLSRMLLHYLSQPDVRVKMLQVESIAPHVKKMLSQLRNYIYYIQFFYDVAIIVILPTGLKWLDEQVTYIGWISCPQGIAVIFDLTQFFATRYFWYNHNRHHLQFIKHHMNSLLNLVFLHRMSVCNWYTYHSGLFISLLFHIHLMI